MTKPVGLRINLQDADCFCPRCNSRKIEYFLRGGHPAVRCYSCHYFLGRLSKPDEASLLADHMIDDGAVGTAYRNIYTTDYGTMIRCSVCGCMLHESWHKSPKGQFDLIEAEYCPKCGSKFLEYPEEEEE